VELNSEDYENIWLRLKDKFWKHVVFWFSAIMIIIGISAYQLAKSSIKEHVRDFAKTEEFKIQVEKAVIGNIPYLEKRIESAKGDISILLSKLEVISKAPFSVDNNQFTLVGEKGQIVKVEFGQGGTSETIKFKQNFSDPPIVIVTQVKSILSRNIREVAIQTVSERDFSVTLSPFTQKFGWVALGN
jgi:hypothetical protein